MVKSTENHALIGFFFLFLPIIAVIWGSGVYTGIEMGPQFIEEVPAPIETPCPEQEELRHIEAYISYANPRLASMDRQVMAKSIFDNAQEYNLPVGLVVAVIHVESNFNEKAVGIQTKYGRAMGAMQVMWPVHKGLAGSVGVDDQSILTAGGGVKVGCLVLSRYIATEKSITGGLIRFFSQPSPQYVLDRVMTAFLTYRQLSTGLLGLDMIEEAHKKEIASMKRLTKKKGH